MFFESQMILHVVSSYVEEQHKLGYETTWYCVREGRRSARCRRREYNSARDSETWIEICVGAKRQDGRVLEQHTLPLLQGMFGIRC